MLARAKVTRSLIRIAANPIRNDEILVMDLSEGFTLLNSAQAIQIARTGHIQAMSLYGTEP
jgi:hypothetical protein